MTTYDDLSQQSRILYENIKPTLDEISEKLRPVQDSIAQLQMSIPPAIKIFEDAITAAAPIAENLSQMVSQVIPNLRDVTILSQQISVNLGKAIEQLMLTLNFPVIQPMITKEQLEDRLEQMDDHEMASFDKNVEEIIKESLINEKEKINLIEMLRKAKTLAKKALAVIAAINAITSFGKNVHDFVDLANSKLQSTPNSANEVHDIQDNCIGSEHSIDASGISPPPTATPITSELDGED